MKRLLLLSLILIVGCSSEKDEAPIKKEREKPRFEKSFIVYCQYEIVGLGERYIYHVLSKFDSQTQIGEQSRFSTEKAGQAFKYTSLSNVTQIPKSYVVDAPLYVAYDGSITTFYSPVSPPHRPVWSIKVNNDDILKQKFSKTLGECKSLTANQYTSLKDEYITIFKNFEANKTKYAYEAPTLSVKEWILRDKYKYYAFEDYQIKAP